MSSIPQENLKKSFWFHLLMVVVTFFVIYMLFFWELGCLTHHGEQVKLPNLKGKPMDVAIKTLTDLHFAVQIDSTFDPMAKPLSVLKQVPDTGSIVKTGRIVMLTVNSVTPIRVPMPNLISLSYRSAAMLLKNNKMFIGDTTYVDDIARGAIKEQRYKGVPIRPGELIPQGSKISLIIGNGLGNTDFDVPEVIRMNIDEALAIINQYNLIPNIVVEQTAGIISDTNAAFIINQIPAAFNNGGERNKIKMGAVIDLYIKQNPEPGDYPGGQSNNPQDKNVDKTPVPSKEDE